MKTGLFFGSFNPIHVGHLIIAQTMLNETDLEEVWFVVSPHSPFKNMHDLLPENNRLKMVELAIAGNDSFKASDVEFEMPKPSYTIDTLEVLSAQHLDREFSIIMGGDNLPTLNKWKRYEDLVSDYNIYVYNRINSSTETINTPKSIIMVDAPLLNISATSIRKDIKEGKSIRYKVTNSVYIYIQKNNFYK